MIMVMIVSPSSQMTGGREEEWQGIRKYLDPNPHLKGVDMGRNAPKVSETRVFQFQVQCMNSPLLAVQRSVIVGLVYVEISRQEW